MPGIQMKLPSSRKGMYRSVYMVRDSGMAGSRCSSNIRNISLFISLGLLFSELAPFLGKEFLSVDGHSSYNSI